MYLKKKHLEIQGIEPWSMTCKIIILPIKLYPLSEKGIEPSWQNCQQSLSLSCIPIPALGLRLRWFEHPSELSWAVCFAN